MQIYIVMGVSGVGKTTIGKLLSRKLKTPFYDADDFHPQENIQKMKNAIPLTDEDRKVWLELLACKIKEWHKEEGAVLACSALKEKYREQLQSVPEEEMIWIFLHAEYEVILNRLSGRKDHYFNPELLQSQFQTLQIPGYGIHVSVEPSAEKIVENIMEKIKQQQQKSEIGLLGLGVMGSNLALNLASKGVRVAVFNRHLEGIEEDIAKNFASKHREMYEFPWFDELRDFVIALEKPRIILLMVNAGKAVDLVIESLIPFLEEGDLLIDGGNSHYKDTVLREKRLKEKGVLFMGVGISGGEEGAKKGPSIMPGGSIEAYQRVGKLLEKIAAKDKDGNPCCVHIGPDGAGHFVKMLHNGIEYGEMQLIAEFYHFMRFNTGSGPEKIAQVFEEWNREMDSYLLKITVDILRTKENGEFLIDKILDAAKQKGTGGWSTNAALELGVPLDTITAAVMARNLSGKKQERLAAMDLYKPEPTEKKDLKGLSEELMEAYKAGSIINHATGFGLLAEASKSYNWDLNLSEIARIWTNGCIIRSQFMEDLVGILKEHPSENLLTHRQLIPLLKDSKPAFIKILAEAFRAGLPMPVLSAAANYFLGFISGQSSANIIQAQRDYFGAHTYERKDRERGEYFHTQWKTPD